MSFWGQNGVTKDVAGAVRRYRKIALRMKDAGAIYDYAILLMKVAPNADILPHNAVIAYAYSHILPHNAPVVHAYTHIHTGPTCS
jgi:hypothetical protein